MEDNLTNKPIDPDLIIKNVNNAVVLPDGKRKEPMGSGYITGLLGVGGMANVYEIWNPYLEINRAVKLLHPNYTEEALQRFETEVKITAKLHHPNIIEIHAVGYWNGLPYIEMERIYGVTVDELIAQRGALPAEVCTSIGIMMARALNFSHNQEYVIYGKTYYGVIHRDLKPSNVMITYNGTLKLMDFGIARPTNASIHTTDGSILGTMQYLSPEQLEGKEVDIRTDIYSIGAVLYEMIAGIKVFPEQNVSKLMMSKVKNDFKPLDNFDVQIPAKFSKLVHRCLIHNPERRIQDTTNLLAELSRIHKQLTNQTPEQVLCQFIGDVSCKRNVLFERKKNVLHFILIISIMILLSGFVIIFKFGDILTNNQKTISEHNLFVEKKLDSSSEVNNSVDSTILYKSVSFDPAKEEKTIKVASNYKSQVNVKTEENNARQTLIHPDSRISDSTPFKNKYELNDTKIILEKEMQSNNYIKVVQLYDSLSTFNPFDKKMIIYTIRAFRNLSDNEGLRKVLAGNVIDDAEYYLEMAKIKLIDGYLDECIKYLDKCEHTPGAFIDSKLLRVERLYWTAKCKSKIFDDSQSIETKNEALDSWFEIKAELQISQDHRYFKDAEQEMQRITTKMNSLRE